MSQALHLLASNVPGYGLSGVSARSTHVDHLIQSQAKFVSSKRCMKRLSFVCKASSSFHRRNPDFSRQTRHGFSRNRNRENEGRDNSQNLEESDILSSRNGPLLSLPSAPKSQKPPAPGPKEKEIVELFRKVQSQLRDRAAMKEEKRSEPLKGRGKEAETVDSLLKLLRKHSSEQGKRSSTTDTNSNQLENNGSNRDGKGTIYLRSSTNRSSKDDVQESSLLSNRPTSNFQRRSPVPRVKYQPIYSAETKVDSPGQRNLNGRRMTSEVEAELELEPELDSELEPEPDVSFLNERLSNSLDGQSSDIEQGYDDADEGKPHLDEKKGLNELKLTELKALAKSRRMKGVSKMKKSELLELLHEA